MSQCIGICQMDEFGYCTGCGRRQDEIDGIAPPAPADADPAVAAPAAAALPAARPAHAQSAGL